MEGKIVLEYLVPVAILGRCTENDMTTMVSCDVFRDECTEYAMVRASILSGTKSMVVVVT